MDFENGEAELERVMTQILALSEPLWQLDTGWSWTIYPNQVAQSRLRPLSHQNLELKPSLERWEKFLLSYFAPNWRADWIDGYKCAAEFWQRRWLAGVHIQQPPTMHERLEARLQLRQWLEQNAPEQIDKLLLS